MERRSFFLMKRTKPLESIAAGAFQLHKSTDQFHDVTPGTDIFDNVF
jgi:hypothetical protein